MASFKESSTPSRPIQATPPIRQNNGRHHSHSVSLGAVNINHRVTRRKSMTSTAANNAAAAVAAVMGETGNSQAIPTTSHHRRGLSARKNLESTSMGSASGFGSFGSRSAANDQVRKPFPASQNGGENGNAAESLNKPISTKNRSRRASEGSHLIRGEGRRVMTELKCDRCGKGYKHSSCLTKHMWEHDPAWAVTSKLLISKHQQVQLLEAATVLVNMNNEPTSSTEGAQAGDSDRSSASPTASGISELRDGLSSTETTPPPSGEDPQFAAKSTEPHRFSVNSISSISRSLQSVPSSSFTGSAPSYSPARSHFRQLSTDTRPSTADTTGLDDDAAGLAAAIELCNFGTPRTVPLPMSPDVPPVPPLPARYLGQSMGSNVNVGGDTRSFDALANAAKAEASSTPTILSPFTMRQPGSYKISDERDVKMEDMDVDPKAKRRSPEEDDFDNSAAPVDDDDDGVFGRMEE